MAESSMEEGLQAPQSLKRQCQNLLDNFLQSSFLASISDVLNQNFFARSQEILIFHMHRCDLF